MNSPSSHPTKWWTSPLANSLGGLKFLSRLIGNNQGIIKGEILWNGI